jgi:hypothetical protein
MRDVQKLVQEILALVPELETAFASASGRRAVEPGAQALALIAHAGPLPPRDGTIEGVSLLALRARPSDSDD